MLLSGPNHYVLGTHVHRVRRPRGIEGELTHAKYCSNKEYTASKLGKYKFRILLDAVETVQTKHLSECCVNCLEAFANRQQTRRARDPHLLKCGPDSDGTQ